MASDDEWGVEINETRTNTDCPYVVSNPENTCDHPAHPHARNNPAYCTKNLCPIEAGKIKKMRGDVHGKKNIY